MTLTYYTCTNVFGFMMNFNIDELQIIICTFINLMFKSSFKSSCLNHRKIYTVYKINIKIYNSVIWIFNLKLKTYKILVYKHIFFNCLIVRAQILLIFLRIIMHIYTFYASFTYKASSNNLYTQFNNHYFKII